MHRRWLGVALVAIVALLPACGSSGGSKSSANCPAQGTTQAAVNGAVTVCAFDIRFDTKTITAPAGPLAITLINKGSIAHTFTMKNPPFALAVPGHNDTKTGTVTLAKGTYDYECTIDSHAAAGMKGKIIVS